MCSVFTTAAGWRDNTTTVDERSTLIVDDVQLDDYITILDILQDDFEPFDGLLQDQFKLPRRSAQTIQSGIPIEQISASFRSLPENVRTYLHSYCHHFDCSISSIQQKSADLVVVNTSNRDCPVRRGDLHAKNHVCLMIDSGKKIVFEYCWDKECQNQVQRHHLHWTDHIYEYLNPFMRNYYFDFKFSI
ncbi:MAG: hypothetical protein GY861_13280 [bacterium]|nr:hypothetical protein [bacterium]